MTLHRWLRRVIAGFATVMLAAGCHSTTSGARPARAAPRVPAAALSTNVPPAAPRIVPVEDISGRVLSYNAQARFALVDFRINTLPVPGQHLEVWRDGQKVGELRTSRWARAGCVAADLLSGEVRTGDEVRAP